MGEAGESIYPPPSVGRGRVLIRCDKCTTLYELDDKLLPPHGAPVQCSRCQFVFTAYPPGASDAAPVERAGAEGRAAEPVPAESSSSAGGAGSPAGPPAEAAPAKPVASAHEPGSGAGPPRRDTRKVAAQAQELAPDAKFTPDGRPIRKVAFPVEEVAPRPPSQGRTPSRASVPVPPTSGRPRWLFPVVALIVALALLGAAWWFFKRGEPVARRRAAHAAAVERADEEPLTVRSGRETRLARSPA